MAQTIVITRPPPGRFILPLPVLIAVTIHALSKIGVTAVLGPDFQETPILVDQINQALRDLRSNQQPQ
ncbi:hypothetical protein CVT26_009770 [Gymnopilus dilepis]|uniref:Uncharacterized protein n=1 Tax=Gymnopilus dilepis TaxID=231916 RepID=A0A409YIU1_9AGAR|nr:hypothetical protein CVT26_009770 [Gymnopilus dilepis]